MKSSLCMITLSCCAITGLAGTTAPYKGKCEMRDPAGKVLYGGPCEFMVGTAGASATAGLAFTITPAGGNVSVSVTVLGNQLGKVNGEPAREVAGPRGTYSYQTADKAQITWTAMPKNLEF